MRVFDVNETSMAIDMHQGDTGAFWVELELEDGDSFVSGDVAIFEVWDGTVRKIHREFDLQPDEPTDFEQGDVVFLIAFRNSDTDTWPVRGYQTEIRMALNPIRADGTVMDGDTVRTVVQSKLNIRNVLIKI